ncbi:MAG: response regulator [Desulfoarculaceae bacterium]|nr:response regulator [Desulfoarculaceae bacterium]
MTEIMVVDDDQDLREIVAEVLREAGFTVAEASRGEEALEHLDHQNFDLILLDLIMPGLSGLELMGRIREKSPRMPVIMITAFASVDNAVAVMQLGASDYITKPFRIDELLASVGRALEEARFNSCMTSLDLDTVLSCLSNPLRRQILALVEQEGGLRFMDLCRKLELTDHTKMNFHLKILKEAAFLDQDDNKIYLLTYLGTQVLGCMRILMKKLDCSTSS